MIEREDKGFVVFDEGKRLYHLAIVGFDVVLSQRAGGSHSVLAIHKADFGEGAVNVGAIVDVGVVIAAFGLVQCSHNIGKRALPLLNLEQPVDVGVDGNKRLHQFAVLFGGFVGVFRTILTCGIE